MFIIDPADAMTVEAQDALLKTLEEPPSAAILILVSAYADTLQPTILSRCRRLRFGLLLEADIARVLVARGSTRPRRHGWRPARAASVARALAGQDEFDADRDAALALLTSARGPAILRRLKASAALTRARLGSSRSRSLVRPARHPVVALADLSALGASTAVPLAHADLVGALTSLVPCV